MATQLIQEERIRRLNKHAARAGEYVLYWMQQSQRAEFNHALELAVRRANELHRPLLVAFGLMDDYPEANLRHYRFMLDGLAEVGKTLERRGIKFVLQKGRPDQVAVRLAKQAASVVCDCGYLRHQKEWRRAVAEQTTCEVVQVESDVVVPVETASNKREYAARTIRPKITRLQESFLIELKPTPVKNDSLALDVEGLDLSSLDSLCDALRVDRSINDVSAFFEGGTSKAKSFIRRFLDDEFEDYADHRNQPQTSNVSHMSKYLHFGQISPVEIALAARGHRQQDDNVASFLEELIIRRELAQNFVNFTPDYDRFSCLPEWAQATLAKHKRDPREHVYTKEQLANAETHDPYWNAAMNEMRHTGYMHNYMRMYWGKKILEWTSSPEYAHRVALDLNNTYFLDGRDANSFANINWIFGLHDRPWGERPVYGTVRSMSASGLERKCDIAGYVEKVNRLVAASKTTEDKQLHPPRSGGKRT